MQKLFRKLRIYTRIKRIIKALIGYVVPPKYIIWQGRLSAKRIALTFDDGPNAEFTEKTLEILKRYDVKATFFLLGEELEKFPELVKCIVEQGHAIGNHLYTHSHIRQMRIENFISEIEKTQIKIEEFYKNRIKLFRSPYCELSLPALLFAVKKGYTFIMYSIETNDFMHKNAEDIISEINAQEIEPGDILLFHDNNRGTVAALPSIIDNLQKRGFEFVKVSELIK
ncbi:MAG: polysaccharide deacetylase family protein [Candidatus Omnitrophota bacterium]